MSTAKVADGRPRTQGGVTFESLSIEMPHNPAGSGKWEHVCSVCSAVRALCGLRPFVSDFTKSRYGTHVEFHTTKDVGVIN
jgi:hypothetical protein